MKKDKDKQQWAIAQFEALKPQFISLLLGAPEYGVTSLSIVFHDGTVKRLIRKYEESNNVEEEDGSQINQWK